MHAPDGNQFRLVFVAVVTGTSAKPGADAATRMETGPAASDGAQPRTGAAAFDDDTVVVEDEVVVKSTSVNPDGTSASATLTLKPSDKDHFTFSGTERIVDGSREPDFELTIARSLKPASR